VGDIYYRPRAIRSKLYSFSSGIIVSLWRSAGKRTEHKKNVFSEGKVMSSVMDACFNHLILSK
jgi:hypothetical protein